MFLLSKSPNTAPELTISHLQDLGMIELRLLLCLSSLYSAPTNIQSVTGLFEFPNQTPYDTHLEINNHGFLWSPVTRPADYIGHLGCNYPPATSPHRLHSPHLNLTTMHVSTHGTYNIYVLSLGTDPNLSFSYLMLHSKIPD